MNFELKQVSSLQKLRANDPLNCAEIHKKAVLAGERFSYQIAAKTDEIVYCEVAVESELSDYIKLYQVKEVYMDRPVTDPLDIFVNEDYISYEPGFMPDVLIPLEEQRNKITIHQNTNCVWVRLEVPKDATPGTYDIKVKITLRVRPDAPEIKDVKESVMTVEILPVSLPEQKLIYTRWFYADCVADQHDAEIFSEKHWEMMEKYIAAAVDSGVNMILVPTHTPPLDTAIGTTRPCVQLIDIEKKGDIFEFNFDKFQRFINICKRQGVKYYEMAHMFSQWGAKCAANIMVTENGKTDYMFGWHVAAHSDEYIAFLKQYIAAISAELEREGISEMTYFHISDEPRLDTLETYKTASDIFRPLIGKSRTLDALSNYDFTELGLIECPVTGIHHIEPFLEHQLENQWAYYCCHPQATFTNSFIAMPSCRTRILGYLLYKFNIKGFLHWGFNFYNSCISYYPVNPYLTTSADGTHPSGDPFIVYPGRDTVYPSIRTEVTYEAIQDMDICFALEEIIGRDAVVEMIDKAAGRDLRFHDYPSSIEFLEGLRAEMIERIAQGK